jgi:hypothetical protein
MCGVRKGSEMATLCARYDLTDDVGANRRTPTSAVR